MQNGLFKFKRDILRKKINIWLAQKLPELECFDCSYVITLLWRFNMGGNVLVINHGRIHVSVLFECRYQSLISVHKRMECNFFNCFFYASRPYSLSSTAVGTRGAICWSRCGTRPQRRWRGRPTKTYNYKNHFITNNACKGTEGVRPNTNSKEERACMQINFLVN